MKTLANQPILQSVPTLHSAALQVKVNGKMATTPRRPTPKTTADVMFYKPQGYHRLAGVMSKDNSIAIFRRFNNINMLNLLSLQAEIFDIQNRCTLECNLDDSSSDSSKQEFSKYFLNLHKFRGKGGQQYQIVLTLQMNFYCKVCE